MLRASSRVRLLLAVLICVCVQVGRPLGAAPAARAGESRWIVESVVTYLTRVARTTRSRQPLPAIPSGAPVWDPATYGATASTLFGTKGPRPAAADHDVRSALVTPTSTVLLAQNARISTVLREKPASSSAHESAALLAGALALRETSSSVFVDPRPLMARMAAHLAAAQALRGRERPSPDGDWAHAVLATLTGDQAVAMRAIGAMALRLDTPADRAWDRALRLRVTGNWREYAAPAEGTLFERLEEARAISLRLGAEPFELALDRLAMEDVIDWGRLVATSNFSVGLGRATVAAVETLEWDEAGRVWQALHPGKPRPADLAEALNAESKGSDPRRRSAGSEDTVLDWTVWSGALQRHLLAAMEAQDHLLWSLGMPDQRAAALLEMKPRAERLALYPVLLSGVAVEDADRSLAVARARQLMDLSPHVITAAAWRRLAAGRSEKPDTQAMPAADSWFVDPVPPGSAFDLQNRALRTGVPRSTTEQLGVWAAAQPYTWWTQWYHQWRLAGGPPPAAAVRSALGSMATYDLIALRYFTREANLPIAERTVLYTQMCDLSFAGCRDLARHLVAEGRDTDAAAAYERWMASSPDAVAVANESSWLVRHYARRGQLARAEALAREAGDAHSTRGLHVWAHFLDARGREAEAELVYQTIRSRYDNSLPLGTFTVRKALRKSDPVLQQRGWNLMKAVFPNGGERLAWNTLTGPPADGVRFQTFGRRANALGLRRRDVIVGVDEWRLRTARQYPVLADLRHDENMTFTVWRDGTYQQIHALVRERWLGAELEDLEPAATTEP